MLIHRGHVTGCFIPMAMVIIGPKNLKTTDLIDVIKKKDVSIKLQIASVNNLHQNLHYCNPIQIPCHARNIIS